MDEHPKNAAVVCPGLTCSLFDEANYDLVVAVNRAAKRVPACDLWVCLDAWTFSWVCGHGWDSGRGTTLVCGDQTFGIVRRKYPHLMEISEHFDHLDHRRPDVWRPTANWQRFGVLVAIVEAIRAGASRVDLWGVDWTGSADWDGFEHKKQHRYESRFAKERKIIGELSREVGERGVVVRRIETYWSDCRELLEKP